LVPRLGGAIAVAAVTALLRRAYGRGPASQVTGAANLDGALVGKSTWRARGVLRTCDKPASAGLVHLKAVGLFRTKLLA
jgi:hypothetical protein